MAINNVVVILVQDNCEKEENNSRQCFSIVVFLFECNLLTEICIIFRSIIVIFFSVLEILEYLMDNDWDMIEGMCQQQPRAIERLITEHQEWAQGFIARLGADHPDVLQRVQAMLPRVFSGNVMLLKFVIIASLGERRGTRSQNFTPNSRLILQHISKSTLRVMIFLPFY